MYSTTLKGIFPEPKPVCRRNFIKENIKSIKHMQGLFQEAGVIQSKPKNGNLKSLSQTVNSRNHSLEKSVLPNPPRFQSEKIYEKAVTNDVPVIPSPQIPKVKFEENGRIAHRAMQTETDLSRLYDTGVIKYPSARLAKNKTYCRGQGDDGSKIMEEIQESKDKNFVAENKQNIKPRPSKQNPVKVMAEPPSTYQRGVVPKYIKDFKSENDMEHEDECPEGHVVLPEEERKETLRVLRQSYAGKIQELNMMPVRSDTLRIKKRKTEIEEELKKIDVGIKVFSRPKVYVKLTK